MAGPANLHLPATPRAPAAAHPQGGGCPRGSRQSWRGHTRILPSAQAIYSRDLSGSQGRRPAAHPPFLAGLPPQPPPATEPPPSQGFHPLRWLIQRGSVSGAAHGQRTEDVSRGAQPSGGEHQPAAAVLAVTGMGDKVQPREGMWVTRLQAGCAGDAAGAGRVDLRTPCSCTPQASGSQPPAEAVAGGDVGRDSLPLCQLPWGKWGRGGPEEGNFPGFFLRRTPRLVQLEKFV